MDKRPIQKSRKSNKTATGETLKIKTQFNPNYIPTKGEVYTKPSLTVPDMSLTVAQLLNNHTRGIGMEAQIKEPIYLGDLEVPHIYDLTELETYRDELEQRQKEINSILEAEQKEKEALKSTESIQSDPSTQIPPKPSENAS